MYRTAKSEMMKRGLKLGDVAPLLDMSVGTLSLKLNGRYPFTLNEAKQFKAIVKSDLPLEAFRGGELMAVFHILKDGSQVATIKGYVVKKADADPLYQLVRRFYRKCNSSKSRNT